MMARYTFSRWLLVGLPLYMALGSVGVLILKMALHLPWATAIEPVAVIIALQLITYIGMYWARRRMRQSHDLRIGVILIGASCLFTGFAVMGYGSHLRLLKAEYLGFTLYTIVVTIITTIIFSLWKFKSESD